MRAKNLKNLGSSPAPKEWAEIQEIKEQRPKKLGVEISLQKLDGHNICVWMIGWGGQWTKSSDYFFIRK